MARLLQTHLYPFVLGGVIDGRLAVLVQHYFGPVPEQPPDHLRVPAAGCEVKRGGAVPVPHVDVHVLLKNLAQTNIQSQIPDTKIYLVCRATKK